MWLLNDNSLNIFDGWIDLALINDSESSLKWSSDLLKKFRIWLLINCTSLGIKMNQSKKNPGIFCRPISCTFKQLYGACMILFKFHFVANEGNFKTRSCC